MFLEKGDKGVAHSIAIGARSRENESGYFTNLCYCWFVTCEIANSQAELSRFFTGFLGRVLIGFNITKPNSNSPKPKK